MALGVAPRQLDLLDPVTRFCEESLAANSIFAFLSEYRDVLFPDDLCADLFPVHATSVATRTMPPAAPASLRHREAEPDPKCHSHEHWHPRGTVSGMDGPQPADRRRTTVLLT